jgi:pyruvate dehydrogenase E1 component alpha subunit
VLIEAKTYRQGGHHVNDPGLYLPKDKLEYYQSKDPVHMHRTYLLQQAGIPEEIIAALEQELERQVEDAAEFARNSPEPSVQRFLEEVSCL